jgi:CheY-like chemotaxis protein
LRFEGWDGLPARLQGDPQRLCQILANLISNALKFTKEGEVRVLAGREAGTENWVLLHFHIRDTGMGIPPEKQGLLFEKFSQLDSSYTRKFGGTGLGLAISKQLVDLMGGEIGVVSPIISENSASSPRPGSDFWFTARVSACASPVGSATGPIPSTLSPGSRILVVEDNPVNQKMLLMLLKKIGIETKSASDGQEALDCLGRERFDLVLMDVQMPVLDGIETTLALRSWPEDNPASHIPIVAVTAHAFPEDRRRCLEAGMNDHLAKPVSRPALEEVLRRWLPSPANSDS